MLLVLNFFKNSAFKNNGIISPEFYMNGKEVFLFAVTNVPKITRELVTFAKIKSSQIKYYIFHQANQFMLNKIFDFLKVEKNKRLFSIKQYGNTSSASIPVTLCKHYKKTGNLDESVLISGFGAGFSFASGIINLKQTKIHKILSYEKK